MTSRTLLLSLHIALVAAWLGADILQYVVTPRLGRASRESALAWARVQEMLHGRYYAVVGVALLLSGIALVEDSGWSWSAGFIWVGITAIVLGGTLGGGGLGALTKKRIAALEAGDESAANAVGRTTLYLSLVVTALPLIAILAMVDKWRA